MKNLIFCVISACIFTACSTEKVVHEPLKNEFMAYTQKFESTKAGNRYLAIASYLNPVFNEVRNEKEDEILLLSVYPKDVLIIPGSVKLNGNEADIEILDENSALLEKTAFKLPYSANYKITASCENKDDLVLTYKTSNDLNANFKFRKISKSLYWNPKLKLDDKK